MQDPHRIEALIQNLIESRDRDPCSEESRRADPATIEELRRAGVYCLKCTELLWTEAPNQSSTLLFLGYEVGDGTPKARILRVDRQDLVRLAESVLHYLGTPIHRQILDEILALRHDWKQQGQ